eukprot:TRINITY_DN28579_c0_g1_i1.p1 TRINITY_DN28579_c0_g1~~TRINITY_DN28579_c0_g1_i1.p1  ORF type:complete len:170 (-),score=35.16 TRINITY_DN28579_c0_g1_i1:13-522(-)
MESSRLSNVWDLEPGVSYESPNIAEYAVDTEEEAQEMFLKHPEAAAYSFWPEKRSAWRHNCFIKAALEGRTDIPEVFSGKLRAKVISVTGGASAASSDRVQVSCTNAAGEELLNLQEDGQRKQVPEWLPSAVAERLSLPVGALRFVLPSGELLLTAPAEASLFELLSIA